MTKEQFDRQQWHKGMEIITREMPYCPREVEGVDFERGMVHYFDGMGNVRKVQYSDIEIMED